MQQIRYLYKIIKTSRPLFWLTHYGAFTFGAVASGNFSFADFHYWLALVLLFLPFSLFVYGINDYYDQESDNHNDRKGGVFGEKHTAEFAQKLPLLGFSGLFVTVVGFGLFFDWRVVLTLIILFCILYFYSAPPLRFKGIAILDFLTGGALYIGLIWLMGYFTFSNTLIGLPAGLILMIICGSSLHIAGAVMDMKPDRIQGIQTTPLTLGIYPTLVLTLLINIVGLIILHNNPLFVIFMLIAIIAVITFSWEKVRTSTLVEKIIGEYLIYFLTMLTLVLSLTNWKLMS
jgi:lycopene elongase/hydratase (dihydrobisanhydrobacterioruberin-forming)